MAHIDWIDHSYNDDRGWRSVGEIQERVEEAVVVRTWGKIIYEDKRQVVIASEERLDKDITTPIYRDYTAIQKKLIVDRGE